MVLKISHKVAFGFSVILLLLFFSSISSFGILTNIETATAKVDNYALPIQNHGNTVQKQLLKQAKSTALITSLPTTTSIKNLKQEFAEHDAILQRNKLKISSLLSAFPNINNLDNFTQSYDAYSQSVKVMLEHREGELSETIKLYEQQQSLYDILDEASAILIDLSFLEDAENQRKIDTIIGSASQIEGYLFNLTDASKSILTLTDIAEVEAAQQTMNIGIDNIEQLLIYLVRLGEEYNTDGLIAQFVDEFERTKQALTSDNNLFSLKIAQIRQREALQIALEESDKQIELAIQAIDEFLQAVDQNLMALQLNTLDNVKRGNLETIIVFVVLFVVGIVIAFVTIRTLTGALKEINLALAKIAKGDLSEELKVTSQDEYGELAKNVNLVVADLRSLIGNITENSHLLHQAADKSSEQILLVSDSLTLQGETIQQANSQTDELAKSAEQIQQSANSAEQQMDSALSQSHELELTATKTSQGMQRLTSMLDDTTDVMTALEQESNNISGILDTIGGISEQTNLLALNAAIEAARAGDVGRGFAVVADEVRLLASRTQDSAGEIQHMIESLQKQTKKAVSDIKVGKDEAINCQKETEQLQQTQLMISNAIKAIHQVSSQIANSAHMQSDLTNNINESIETVVDLSRETSEKSTTTMSYSEQVAKLAAQLDESIGTFKVT